MIIPIPETISEALEMQASLELVISDWNQQSAQYRLAQTAQYTERYQAVEQCTIILKQIAEYQERLRGTK